MEDEHEFYEHGYTPDSKLAAFSKNMDEHYNSLLNHDKSQRILHLKQFDNAYKVPKPAYLYKYLEKDSVNKYDSRFDENENHPWAPPV
jgi:hypothetical protein